MGARRGGETDLQNVIMHKAYLIDIQLSPATGCIILISFMFHLVIRLFNLVFRKKRSS